MVGPITSLILYDNHLRVLPDDLLRLSALTRLVCRRNELVHVTGIQRLTALTVLDLSANALTTLPAEIGTLKSLSNFTESTQQRL